jgi:hypothetical protein
LIGCILLLAVLGPTPPWTDVAKAAESYRAAPSDNRAAALLALLPPRGLEQGEHPSEAAANSLYELVPTLERGVLAGHRTEVRLAFRLLHVSDGAFAEELLQMLGDLAGQHPLIYLEELARCRPEFSSLMDPIQSVGWIWGETPVNAAISQLRQRQNALRSVRSRPLSPLRDECLRVLVVSLRRTKSDGV